VNSAFWAKALENGTAIAAAPASAVRRVNRMDVSVWFRRC
jgi:hypothetical protein